MTNVLMVNDDITVLGPPEVVELLVDIGPQGVRGSQIFVGVGNPNSVSIGQTPRLNDLYINTSPGANYGYLYQYVSEPTGNIWIEVLKINPTIFSKRYTVNFNSGSASISIPISQITTVSGTPLTADNFSIQYSIANNNPVASSMLVPGLVGAGTNLVINFSAVESASGTWQDLDGEATIHLFISIVL
jgi:hypothetical protein